MMRQLDREPPDFHMFLLDGPGEAHVHISRSGFLSLMEFS